MRASMIVAVQALARTLPARLKELSVPLEDRPCGWPGCRRTVAPRSRSCSPPSSSSRSGRRSARSAAIRRSACALGSEDADRALRPGLDRRRSRPRRFATPCERAARYKQLTCPEEIRIVARGERVARSSSRGLRAEEAEPARAGRPVLRLDPDHRPARHRRSPLAPRAVELDARRAHREMYEAHFGCRVKFTRGRATRSSSPRPISSARSSRTTRICWR